MVKKLWAMTTTTTPSFMLNHPSEHTMATSSQQPSVYRLTNINPLAKSIPTQKIKLNKKTMTSQWWKRAKMNTGSWQLSLAQYTMFLLPQPLRRIVLKVPKPEALYVSRILRASSNRQKELRINQPSKAFTPMANRKSNTLQSISSRVDQASFHITRLPRSKSNNWSKSGSITRISNWLTKEVMKRRLPISAIGVKLVDAWSPKFREERSTWMKQPTSRRQEALSGPTGRPKIGILMMILHRKNLQLIAKMKLSTGMSKEIRLPTCNSRWVQIANWIPHLSTLKNLIREIT